MKFVKYHGTGNDFVIIDARSMDDVDQQFGTYKVKYLCDRRFGIGADGLILIREAEGYDFHMDYFNSDGLRSSMCGNGGRCAMHYARQLGMIDKNAEFLAPDGGHLGHFEGNDVAVKMNVATPCPVGEDWEVDTGSPHYVQYVQNLDGVKVFELGQEIRNSMKYRDEGINVNFVERLEGGVLQVATYERGVENETFSCGTGVTAVALVDLHLRNERGRVEVLTKGGRLAVDVSELGVWLIGPAQLVFHGEIDLNTPQ